MYTSLPGLVSVPYRRRYRYDGTGNVFRQEYAAAAAVCVCVWYRYSVCDPRPATRGRERKRAKMNERVMIYDTGNLSALQRLLYIQLHFFQVAAFSGLYSINAIYALEYFFKFFCRR